ncbi:MAG: hypothetical protein LCH81_03715 [Bacteroidetes bacterium]|nr:hypothetical protein [Bacteroidota bacterium]
MAKQVSGKNGGTLMAQQPGDPGLPGAGRPKNPFKEAIRAQAEGGHTELVLDGFLVVDGEVTGERVKVQVSLPAAEAVVVKMFRKAAKKGDVAAARWLSETGFGKTINLGDDPENPLGGGFAVILPDNKR